MKDFRKLNGSEGEVPKNDNGGRIMEVCIVNDPAIADIQYFQM